MQTSSVFSRRIANILAVCVFCLALPLLSGNGVGQTKVDAPSNAKAESKWTSFIREIPDTTGILNAVLDGNLAKVKELVQKDPSLLKKEFGKDEMTLLHIVSVDGDIEVLKYLIEQNADVNAKDRGNWTPIALAGMWGEKPTEAILYLLANGSLEPDKNCREFSQKMQQLMQQHAAMGGDPAFRTRLVKERNEDFLKAQREIAIAKEKSGKDLQKYVLKKVK